MHPPRAILSDPNYTLALSLPEEEAVEQVKIVLFGTRVEDDALRIQLPAHQLQVVHLFNQLDLDKCSCTSSKRRWIISLSRGATFAASKMFCNEGPYLS